MRSDVFIGIDVGGTKTLATVGHPDGTSIATTVRPTPGHENPEQVVAVMAEAARATAAMASVALSDVRAVSVAAAGGVNVREGTIVYSPHLSTMSNTPVSSMLGNALELPVFIGNDANLAAIAEHRYGAGKGVKDLLFITLSTGIGGAIIIGGNLFTGSTGFAGEVGHMTVDALGPYGASTTPGAWESLCSGSALARIASERLAAGERSSMTSCINYTDPGGLKAEDVFTAYKAGDALGKSIIERAVLYLGTGLASLVNLLNPETIIIGGGLSNEWDTYVTPAVTLMRSRSFAGAGQLARVVPPALGAEAGALGAIAFASDSLSR